MRTPLTLAAALSLACAIPRSPGEPSSIPISVSSHNRRSVDVYLLCGDRDAQWLGVVHGKEAGLFESRPRERVACRGSISSWSPRLQSGLLGRAAPAADWLQRSPDDREVCRLIGCTCSNGVR